MTRLESEARQERRGPWSEYAPVPRYDRRQGQGTPRATRVIANSDRRALRQITSRTGTDFSFGVSYVYQLTAQGTTHGFEQGYVAFLGDPFGSDVTSSNLVLSTSSVPEPA
jgi:hypothetical protein